MFANCRSQFLLDRLGRCLYVSSDSTSCHEFASQFCPAFFVRKTSINYHESRSSRIWLLNRPAAPVTMRSRLNGQRPVGAAATTAVILSRTDWPKQQKSASRNGDNQSLYLHGLNNVVYNYYVAYAFVVCVKIDNEEFFLMLSCWKIHIILFLICLGKHA